MDSFNWRIKSLSRHTRKNLVTSQFDRRSIFSIVVTYNGIQYIEKCLDSLITESTVIVVDNNSSDGTVNFINNKYKDVILIRLNKNLGFGQGNNIGIGKAIELGACHIFLLNQDAYAISDCISKLVATSKLNPSYGILSPIHFNKNKTELDKSFQLLAPRELLGDMISQKSFHEIYPVSFINAAAWLIPVSVLKNIGGFDPIFFHYGEDVNFSQRVRFHGYKSGIISSAAICHDSKNIYYELKTDSQSKIRQIRNELLIRLADINNFSLIKIYRFKLYLIRQCFLNILLFNNDKARLCWLKLKEINVRVLTKSIRTNRNIGPHYL
ncbi:glycosyltransferase family 2 protein [Flavobacteriaceae bacterium]|nr:glycosyltransferase family 2 protein [Flavobacteriaceae bacterium]